MRDIIARLTGILAICTASMGSAHGAVAGESVVVGAGTALELTGRYFRPEGAGPFPAALVMHGSGGLWKNDNPAGGEMSRHFEEWAQLLAAEGYVSLFVDSYAPRGIVEFPGRRPAEDPEEDDAICSPAYERPKDVFKGLRFLHGRAEVSTNRIGLLGFSQGAETCLSSLLSASITKANWSMTYLKLDGTTESRAFPAPPRLDTPTGFAVAVVYYPGCGYYGYFGSPSGASSNLFMPYAPTLILHGSADSLYSANLYPEKFVLKSGAQAAATGLPFNPLSILVYQGAGHSFDEATAAAPNEPESANQTAKRLSRQEALRWFGAYLKSPRLSLANFEATWPGLAGATHRLLGGTNVNGITNLVGTVQPAKTEDAKIAVGNDSGRKFFQLETILAPF